MSSDTFVIIFLTQPASFVEMIEVAKTRGFEHAMRALLSGWMKLLYCCFA